MRQRPGLRLFVVSDRNDKLVSYRSQLEFVERVKAHNLPITHVIATATDKDSHDLFLQGLRLAVDCANEARDQVAVNKGLDQVPVPLPSQPPPPTANPNPQLLVPSASQPKISDRVGQPPAQSDTAQPANNPGSGPAAAVAQRVVLYEEDPTEPRGKRFVGSAIWRTETISPGPGHSPELAIRADIEIPERKLAMTWSLRRNTDQSLPASHTIEVMFKLPADFPAGSVDKLPGILMKQTEQTRGVALAAVATKVTNGFFLIGLSAVATERDKNIQLLKERSWLDIPVVYTNNRRAILALEKGTPGEKAFAEAFATWKQ
jgi:hypothetical protein